MATKSPIRRTYSGFRGVDFANEPSLVNVMRSPNALNVWRNYNDIQGECIETRPGIRKIGQIGDKILGIYIINPTKAIVHSGNSLYEWNNFPDTPIFENLETEDTPTVILLFNQMNRNQRSSFNKFGNNLYINDGINYLKYDGTNLSNVSDDAFIPTTTIGRSPTGGGEMYQDVNVLSNKRTNAFTGNGTATVYQLDAVGIESVTKVVVNNTELSDTDYSVNTGTGTVTFNTAPSVPSQSGQDNVFITFQKTIQGYADRIQKCTRALIWDNRIFYTGNPDYPNALFHCELNNPEYVSDLAYYEDGTSDSAIKDLVVGSDVLWVLKNKDQNNANVFYHTRAIDNESGKLYPCVQGNVEVGCNSVAINFLDDIVYLSKSGLQGIITSDLQNKQVISPRSHLINSKLTNNSDFYNAQMENWNGYLFILVGNEVYLADSRQKSEYLTSFEYEWYYWKFTDVTPNLLKEFDGKLYIGDDNGYIYCVEGTNDDGKAIKSYWTTPMDNFGYPNHYKTTNKRGGLAKIKTIPNGRIKIAEITNKREDNKYITSYSATGFDFNNIDFANFAFVTSNNSYIVYKIKEKKFTELALVFYSDEIDKPFGVYSAMIETFIGAYVKR